MKYTYFVVVKKLTVIKKVVIMKLAKLTKPILQRV